MRTSVHLRCLVWGALAATVLLSGCAVGMKVPIKDPVPSTVRYSGSTPPVPTALAFKDERSEGDKGMFLTGLIPMQLVQQDKPFDDFSWLATHTVGELAARGLPVTLAQGSVVGVPVGIQRWRMLNHRASAYSPFVTFTSLRAEVMTPQGPRRVVAYVKRGKVPVWSFDEVIDPTFNDALALATKELAAKINQQLFGQVVSTEQVNLLIAAIAKDGTVRADAYLDVYQLGFSNNPAAVPELVKLTSHPSEYVRLAAISSLGILRASNQLPLLIGLYEAKTGIWQDRAMALKAIGDIDGPESRAYLQSEWVKLEKLTDKNAIWTKEIIALYR
jgi:hypothetical protein